jgi:hypothetical protein
LEKEGVLIVGIAESFLYTAQIFKKGFLVCLKYPLLFLYPFISFGIFLTVEALVWVLIYFRYGIHFFNADTLELWGLISLWELSFFILVLIAPLYFLIMVNMIMMQVCVAHTIFQTLSSHRLSAYESIAAAFHQGRLIVQYAWAKTIVIIGGETPLKHFLKKWAHHLGIADFLIQAKSDKWIEVTTLMVPLIATRDNSLKELIDDSATIMEKNFGVDLYAIPMFAELFIIITVIACYSLETLVSYIWNEGVGVALIFFILGLFLTIMMVAEGIFYTAVYQYCLKQPLSVFTPEDITKGFERVENQEKEEQ